MVDVALQIKQLIDKGTEPGEIAVIYRNHSQVEELVQYLDTQKDRGKYQTKDRYPDAAFRRKDHQYIALPGYGNGFAL